MRESPAGRRRLLALAAVSLAICAAARAAPADAASRVYWSNAAGRISYADLDGSGGGNLATSGASGGPGFEFFGLAIDLAGGRLYWADTNFGHPSESAISYANLDGSGGGDLETGAAAVEEPLGVAVDPAAGRVYWANAFGNRISYANLDGSGGGNLDTSGATVDEPVGVAVDSATGRIYWANAAANDFGWAALDGSGGGNVEITGPPTVDKPEGVAVDSAAGRIYWANRNAGQISWANLDGSGGEDLVTTGATVDEPIGVAVDPVTGRVYWGNFAGGIDKKISSAALDGSGGEDLDIAGAIETGSFGFPALLKTPSGTAAPSVSGGSDSGSTLACSEGAWAADRGGDFLFQAPRSLEYAWQLDGTDLPGATATTLTASRPGSYRCRVTAVNQAGSAAQASAPFTVTEPASITEPGAPTEATTALPSPPAAPLPAGPVPPNTKILKARLSPAKRRVSFRFAAIGAADRFQCRLSKARRRLARARFRSCRSPKTYAGLKPGRYRFEVRAIGPGGVDPSPAKKRITVRS